MKYRKKPVVIEAKQWFQEGDHSAVSHGYLRLSDHAVFGVSSLMPESNVAGCVHVACIKTLEGWHEVTPGDWIITGIKGEHYPCKPDIFEATYEPA